MDLKFDRSAEAHERALRTIPLASQTFSKAAMSTVEGAAPLFLDRGRGASVWDIDNQRYIDYVLGLMPIVLGYCDPDVDDAVRKQLDKGIVFSLATELEAELAELLVGLIPCAEMVRFGKNGSDATSAAIRLARAFTGRDKVAICGYHGWHDWYIGSTTRHRGVPQAVRDLSSSFNFNDADSLAVLLEAEPAAFAAVVMEPMALEAPKPGFLEDVRQHCDKHDVVLVFDEIVTGFRVALGGAQAVFGVTPDLSCFGKAMANGMPISAIVGRREVMRLMEDIFFSGTFGGEALSLAASIATLEKLRKEDAIPRIAHTGEQLREGVRELLISHDVTTELKVVGGDWWPGVIPSGDGRADSLLVASLLRQELASNGLLMGSTFNLCLSHCSQENISETLEAFDRALTAVSAALCSNDPASRLRGRPIQPVFQVRKRNNSE